MNSVDLFVGAGGMAVGLAQAGFRHAALIERDHHACETLRENQRRGRLGTEEWPLYERDAREFDYSAVRRPVDLLAAGVPCQPFSIGGKHAGHRDERNMFPEVGRAVRHLQPKAILLENVRGLLRPSFARYFSYVQLSVAYPELTARPRESWLDHLGRLERHHTSGRRSGLFYRVVFRQINAADYGVPQRRERVFVVGVRGDLSIEWSFPKPTHTVESLMWAQWVSGEYWEAHGIPRRLRPAADPRWQARLEQLRLFPPERLPWRTVRDAISDLPEPTCVRGPEEPDLCHFRVEGARRYTGHTGSNLDRPAKTLKAGDHGVPGGENMLEERPGAVRYFTLRESARLQAFPDEFIFPGSWTESMRQIGNAVPVSLARVIGEHLVGTLRGAVPRPNAAARDSL